MLSSVPLIAQNRWCLLPVAEGRYVLRYLNGQHQPVVACEFDTQFRWLSETRVSIKEWKGSIPTSTLQQTPKIKVSERLARNLTVEALFEYYE